MLRRLLFGEPSDNKTDIEGVVPEIEGHQTRHQYNEVQILLGHDDLVEFVLRIDDNKILTAGHDKKAIIWDCETGGIVCELSGHKRTITAAIVIKKYLDSSQQFCDVIVTASSDESIKIWDMTTGRCKRTITEHKGTVKCFSVGKSEPCVILTAGQDICVWDAMFKLLAIYQRNSLDYIHTAINLKTGRFVLATDQPTLYVYNTPMVNEEEDGPLKITEFQKLSPHRESVTCLILISDAMFASASMDGAIIIWTAHRLVATRKFNHFDNFVNITDHTYPYSVQHLIVAEKYYIFAAIGCGFAIFDARYDDNKKCIGRVTNAHHSQVTSLIILQNGRYLASSSLDGTVRLWSGSDSYKGTNETKKVQLRGPVSRLFHKNISDFKKFPLKLDLVGQFCGHSNSVTSITDCGEEGFVSVDNDGVIILWKDCEKILRRRDQAIRSVLSKLGWMKTNS